MIEDGMQDASDVELQKTEDPPPPVAPPSRGSPAPWIIAGVAVVALAGVVFYYQRADGPAAPDGVTGTEAEVSAPSRPLGADAEPIALPPLDATDALVRDLVKALSTHPKVAAWLATDGLIRNFVQSVDDIANGRSPAARNRVLRPGTPFPVVETRGGVVIDVRGYNRYNDLAAAISSVDPRGAAMLYSQLRPRIQEAYEELGYSIAFDRALEAAIVRVLKTPVVEGDIALIRRGALYVYNDSRLEGLSAAERQVMRMGPRNVRTIQRTLRDIGRALGIPEERLRGGA